MIVQHHPVWTGTHSSTQTSWALPTRKSRVHVAHEAPPGASLGTPAEAPRHAVVRRLRKDSEETFFYFSIMVVKLRLTYSNGLPISIFGCWGTLYPSISFRSAAAKPFGVSLRPHSLLLVFPLPCLRQLESKPYRRYILGPSSSTL